MSLVPQKLLTIGIPTVVAVLSILWFRNRRKGQHHPVDQTSIKVKKEILDENSSTTEIITIDNNQEDICMSVEDTVTIAVETSNNNNLISGRDSGRCMKYKDSLCDSNSSKVIEAENIVVEALPSSVTEREVNSLKKPVEQIINFTVIPESASAIELEGKQGTEISEIIEGNELSTSEIFSVESEVESEKVLGEIESQKELGEIEMKKDKEQLQESINTLDLNKMKEAGELVEKLASLELDQMKMDERKEGSERDSANHSPSEIMLASPSISNFSDAHSEGSSDSGKGQSDGATSPSRTPAGGSSLAGDQAPSVYEFVLPQVIVGRLIGRHGVFLNEIKTQTHTNIFIKRHPDSNKLKVCAIEGTPQDIDKALTKIRQKFPVRRFPELTLEKVSFVQVNPLPPLKPEDFHLQLVEGVNNDVVLSSLISAAHFFLQQPCHPSYSSLVALNSIMTQIYSSGEAPILEAPVNYAVCAAPALEGWYRAQIVNVEDDGLHCTIKYLDYGGYSRIAASDLRQIRGDLLALPFQAVECYLANVVPPPGEDWSEEARLFVHGLTCGQILHAQVYDYAEDGAPLVYLYTSLGNQVVLVNEALVVHGYGVISESSSCGATSEEGGRTDEETGKSE